MLDGPVMDRPRRKGDAGDGALGDGALGDGGLLEGAVGYVSTPVMPGEAGAADGAVAGRRLRDFVRGVRESWPALLGGLLAGLLLSIAVLRATPPRFTATMVVGPTARVGAAAMGARVPMLVGRETAFATAEPGPGDEILSDFARYLQLLGSVPVARRLMADPTLVQALFPARWDAAARSWRPPPGPLAWAKRSLFALVGRSEWVEPDAARVAQALRDRLVVEMLRTGPMHRIRLRDTDRARALRLLTAITAAADAHLRAEAARRSAAEIAHIRERLTVITAAEDQRALSALLAEQERLSMMIAVDLPFAADPIEPPGVADQPDWPDPVTVVPLAGLAGLAAGAVVFNLRRTWRAAGRIKPALALEAAS